MCKRPLVDRPVADGTAAHGRGEAILHQEPAEPPFLWGRDADVKTEIQIKRDSEPCGSLRTNTGTEKNMYT